MPLLLSQALNVNDDSPAKSAFGTNRILWSLSRSKLSVSLTGAMSVHVVPSKEYCQIQFASSTALMAIASTATPSGSETEPSVIILPTVSPAIEVAPASRDDNR